MFHEASGGFFPHIFIPTFPFFCLAVCIPDMMSRQFQSKYLSALKSVSTFLAGWGLDSFIQSEIVGVISFLSLGRMTRSFPSTRILRYSLPICYAFLQC